MTTYPDNINTDATRAIWDAYAHATIELLERIDAQPKGLDAARWMVALETSESLDGMSRREFAEFLLDGYVAISTYTPEQCAGALLEETRDMWVDATTYPDDEQFTQAELDTRRDAIVAFITAYCEAN